MIAVEDVCSRAGSFRLDRISFSVPTGAYAVLMGRTGCGKTTLLETLCGLTRATAGHVKLMGGDATRFKPAQRGIGYVPQDRALFTTMSVYENLAFALRLRQWEEPAVAARVHELADLLAVRPLLVRRPTGLSGGELQRVALGRALAARPPILLLDEPLSALDDQTRRQTHALLNTIRRQSDVTVLHVTHHLDDAEQLADMVLLMDDGMVRSTTMDEVNPGKSEVRIPEIRIKSE